MKIKFIILIKICCIYITLFNSIAFSTQEEETELNKCNINILDSLFNRFSYGLKMPKDFDDLYLEINMDHCSISKENLKKSILLIYQQIKFDTSLSYIEYEKSCLLWWMLLTDWDKSVEELVIKENPAHSSLKTSATVFIKLSPSLCSLLIIDRNNSLFSALNQLTQINEYSLKVFLIKL